MAETSVHTYTHFLQRDPLYDEEKPYSLRYTALNGFPRANIKLDRQDILVSDIRPQKERLRLEDDGFCIWDFHTDLPYQDFDSDAKVKGVYLAEVADRLRDQLGAAKVQIFEHTVRKRHAEFPISTGEPYTYNQPTSIAHVDTTIPWCHAMMQQLNPGMTLSPDQRVQCIKQVSCALVISIVWMSVDNLSSIWKPLRGPVRDWPLALCEPSSLNAQRDLEPCDLVYPDYVVENRQVYHSEKLRWIYLSDQREDEAWVFMQTDTDHPTATVAHTAVPLTRSQTEVPRESIEVRALVLYEDCE